MSVARLSALAAQVADAGLGALLVTAPANVRYLTGFSGSNGLVLVPAAGSGQRPLFLTDFRYEIQAEQELGAAAGECERAVVELDLLTALAEALGAEPRKIGGEDEIRAQKDRGDGGEAELPVTRRAPPIEWLPPGSKLGFEDAHLTVARHGQLAELLDQVGVELVPGERLVEKMREVKDAEERRRIAAAAALADAALRQTLRRGLFGRTEREVAIELDTTMRTLGAQAPSFPTIVAAGTHAALPHAQPRDVEISRGELVIVDWGALLDGYCSDCTRTYAAGPVDGHAQEVYAIVLAAQRAGLASVAAGRTGPECDAAARAVIDAAGYSERFGHGLGHGVGIEVHEGPRLSRRAGNEPLRAGTVVTVEPGIYLPGDLGVRIEELVFVTQNGCENVSSLTNELTVID